MSEAFPKDLIPLYSYALSLLSAREYSEKMLEEKIEKKFPQSTPKERGVVIDFLTAKKYLDEERTAENFLRYRREYSPRGKRMIAQDMYKKKFNPSVAKNILDTFSEEEEQHDCDQLAQQKWIYLIRFFSDEDNDKNSEIYKKTKEKLFRFLAGKGFPYSLIQSSWERISRDED